MHPSRLKQNVLSLADFERIARQRLPAPIYGYVSGACEDNLSLEANRKVFADIELKTRVLVDISQRSQACRVFDVDYDAPFGIAPMGVSALSAYRGDVVLAEAAQRARVPAIMSGWSLVRLEEVAQAAPDTWFQAYLAKQQQDQDALIDRVEAAGFRTLVITVDTPTLANRENNVRVGFSSPLRPTLRLALQGLARPRWLAQVFFKTLLRHGMPHFENWDGGRGLPIISNAINTNIAQRGSLSWQHVRTIRRRWKGPLVLKGILCAEDAVLAAELGVDGIIVSNHGGRQLDGAATPLRVLPSIVEAFRRGPVMLDSGVRRGTDIVKALALGASCVFIGRPFNYAAAVAGSAGVDHAIDLLRQEVLRDMAMMGVTSIAQLDSSFLLQPGQAEHAPALRPPRPPTSMNPTEPYDGADALCDTLLANGVDVCFTNPGTSEMHFVAALDRKPRMRCLLGTFEGVVTGAADGYARMADKPAATLLHTGPGLANGLANLHNARRAGTPVVNIVGDHASHHLQYDAPLTTDIESLARPMSGAVRRVSGSDDVSTATAEAIEASRQHGGQVSTLILPADAAWSPAPRSVQRSATPTTGVNHEAVKQVLQALRGGRRATIVLGGQALRAEAIAQASRVATACGARLMAKGSVGRMERGQGRVMLDRVPYPIDQAIERFAGTELLVLVETAAPVAFFAYPDKPSRLTPPGCETLTLARPGEDGAQALAALAEGLGVAGASPAVAGPSDRIELPDVARAGDFDATAIIRSVAALLPEQAIIADEAITSMRQNFAMLGGAAPHDHIQQTGGAIGAGIPLATGAAVACPDRKVVCLQADGSGLYTLQGLWTQAREKLDVLTIVFANRRYAILYNELRMMGRGEPGHNARRMLDLDEPAFDWVALGRASGVESARADDLKTFIDLLRTGLKRRGPFLIEARI